MREEQEEMEVDKALEEESRARTVSFLCSKVVRGHSCLSFKAQALVSSIFQTWEGGSDKCVAREGWCHDTSGWIKQRTWSAQGSIWQTYGIRAYFVVNMTYPFWCGLHRQNKWRPIWSNVKRISRRWSVFTSSVAWLFLRSFGCRRMREPNLMLKLTIIEPLTIIKFAYVKARLSIVHNSRRSCRSQLRH